MTSGKEVYAYLHAIAHTWEYILGDVRPDQLDESTVLALQMYFPVYSSSDCDAILELFVANRVFPLIQDVRDRENIGRRVLSCKRIVTLTSFFNDFIYLRTCFDGLKALLPATWKEDGRSFEQAFAHNWRPDSKSDGHERTSERHFERPPDNFRDCYVELWLFAMREFPCLSDGKASRPLQDGTTADNQTEPWSPVGPKQAQLAYQASNIGGFETDEIEKLKASHPMEIPQDAPSPDLPEISSNNDTLRRKDRSNRPSETNYPQFRRFLYRAYVHDTSAVEQKKHATAYAIARDIVHCCWRPDIDRWLRDVEVHEQPQYSSMEKSFNVTHTKGPRVRMTRPFKDEPRVNPRPQKFDKEKYKVSKQQNNQRADKNLNDNQQLYRRLMVEAEAEFAVRDTHSGASLTSETEWYGKPQKSARVTSIKEEVHLQDNISQGIENDHSDNGLMPTRPLEYTVGKLRSSSGTQRSVESRYSIETDQFLEPGQRIKEELDLLESTSISQGESSPSKQEYISELSFTGEAPNASTEEVAGSVGSPQMSDVNIDQQLANPSATSTIPAAIKNKASSTRKSPKE